MLQKTQPKTPLRAEIEGRETKAIKQAMLASNHFETGTSSLEHYVNLSKKEAPQILDLVVAGLSADA